MSKLTSAMTGSAGRWEAQGSALDSVTSSDKFWDARRETMAPGERDALILERLKHQLHYVYNDIPFYRDLYKKHNFHPSEVQTLDDFTRLVPVVTKKMLVEDQKKHPPFGSYLGVSPEQLARVHGSSGTSGTPTIYGVSQKDWERAGETAAMALWTSGIRSSDRVQITFPFALFFGGWGVLQAVERIGAAAFPTGASVPTDQQVEFIHKLGITVVVGTPSYHIYLATRARELGLDLNRSKVRLLICGGEPGGSIASVRSALRDLWGEQVLMVDGSAGSSSEMYPFLTTIGCNAHEGGVHLYQDENYTEIVSIDDPNQSVPVGASGATVATHLWRESQPMIRFWMGDESYMDITQCPCGRTYPRLPAGIQGRIDDMLIIRGANIYPSAVESVIRSTENVGKEFRIIVQRNGALDELKVSVEMARPGDSTAEEALKYDLERKLKQKLQIRIAVEVVQPGTYEEQVFKARRVIDHRSPQR